MKMYRSTAIVGGKCLTSELGRFNLGERAPGAAEPIWTVWRPYKDSNFDLFVVLPVIPTALPRLSL
jgi:hypothetical protein